jgi:nucleosome binding factor SPN SPT16 subunit
MKTVNEDPHTFYEDGGWEFLTGGDDVSYPYRQRKKADELRSLDRASHPKDQSSTQKAMIQMYQAVTTTVLLTVSSPILHVAS